MLFGMKKFRLTEDEKSALESRHRKSSDGKERDRIRGTACVPI